MKVNKVKIFPSNKTDQNGKVIRDRVKTPIEIEDCGDRHFKAFNQTEV
jgi:hypothetical protein